MLGYPGLIWKCLSMWVEILIDAVVVLKIEFCNFK